MKKIMMIMAAAILCFTLASCNSSKKQDKQPENNTAGMEQETTTPFTEEKKAALETEYGTIYYPAKWEDDFITDQEKKDDILTITFSTKIKKKTYDLFTVTIAGEEGDSVGTITDKNGTKRNVFIEMLNLEDSDAKENVKNQLYAMQESINSMIDYLK